MQYYTTPRLRSPDADRHHAVHDWPQRHPWVRSPHPAFPPTRLANVSLPALRTFIPAPVHRTLETFPKNSQTFFSHRLGPAPIKFWTRRSDTPRSDHRTPPLDRLHFSKCRCWPSKHSHLFVRFARHVGKHACLLHKS